MPPAMVAKEREVPGIMEMHWNKPMVKARPSVSGASSLRRNHLSTKSSSTPTATSMTATTHTLPMSPSMKSPSSSPMTAAGRKATKSFQ